MAEQKESAKTASGIAFDYSEVIKGKIILTTGVSPGGLGAAFVHAIAPMQPGVLILAGRSPAKTQKTALEVQKLSPTTIVHTLEVDFGSLASVRAAAEVLRGWTDVPHIDVLVNNAGIGVKPWTITEEGFELLLVTNHLGPFLFTNLVMSRLLASQAPRVINIASDGHIFSPIRFDDPNFRDESVYHTWLAYGQSKTANMLMAISLAEKLGTRRNLQAFSVHPGPVTTNIGVGLDWGQTYQEMARLYRMLGFSQGWESDFEFHSPDEGAATFVYAAFDPDIKSHNGAYLLECRLGDPWKDCLRAWGTSSVEAEMLWKLSEKLIRQEFAY
ncbi:NAD(P)-binding protein [Hypoxylon crocopeplum]|nr:NAD(P)-binding protein [Hypoxylon crocopeplum]